MKTLFFSFFCFTFLFTFYASGQSSFIKHYETKEALESDANKIIADFEFFIKELGYNLPSIPKVKIQTEPALIRLDRPNNTLIVPYWGDLANDQIEIFKSWRGENAEEFFILMFNWFFIPHELGHYINPMIYDLNPYQCELEANEVAIAFIKSDSANLEKLDFIKESLKQILEILPKIDFGDMSETEYFNANYQKIGNNPNEYGYFQFKFFLDILNNPGDVNIKLYFEK
ncbi:MAG: hypothetical protein LLG13_15055 [Bacteroidales bacterium]|nr:hypothetical protein [Bacteroidales bacterium]